MKRKSKKYLGLLACCLSLSTFAFFNNTRVASAYEEEPYLSWNFEDNRAFEAIGSSSARLIDKDTCPEGVYDGDKALEVSGIWARQQFNSGAQYSDMLVNGDFYEIDMFAKRAATGSFSVICQLSFWGDKPGVGWKASSTRIYATPYVSLNDDEWHELKYKFAVYGDGINTYLYHKNGT